MRKRLEAPPGGLIPGPRQPLRGRGTPVRHAVRLRGRAVRLMPPRCAPHYARQNWEIKGCPNGYRLEELGTRPVDGVRGCPVRHGERPVAD